MTISVIIPTFNRRELLARTLVPVFNQDFPPEDFEVVVTVDGATDGTSAMLRSLTPSCRLTIIDQPNSGPAIARNTAVNAARGDVLLFLDDDILCSRTLLREHAAAHAAGGSKVVAFGPILVSPESPHTLIAYATGECYEAFNERLNSGIRLDVHQERFLIGNRSVRRDLFLACGGFALDIIEDVELGLRLTAAGAVFRYCPNALVYEIFSKSTRTFLHRDVVRQGEDEVLLSRRHPDYRPFSELSTMGGRPIGRHLLRSILLRSPVSPTVLLDPALLVLERFCRHAAFRRAGLTLLALSRRVTLLRSATHNVGSYRALHQQFGMRLPVLIYHHIGPPGKTSIPGLTISPRRFRAQMRWLALRGYTTITARQWVEWVSTGAPLPRKPILLTFDDGYADLAEFVFPVLRQFDFTGEVFLITRHLGGTNSFDHGGQPGTLTLLTSADVAAWSKAGISFGAHTQTHPKLTQRSTGEIEEEVGGSARDVAAIIGEPPAAFVYPYGDYNAFAHAAARRHFQCAFSTEEGINELRTDLFVLKRLWIPPDRSLLDFSLRIWLGWSPIGELRSLLRVRSRAIAAWRKFAGAIRAVCGG